jgi:acyl carrier protein
MTTAEAQNEDLRRQLMNIVIEEGMLEGKDIAPDDKLSDVGIQSADFVMILMAIEEKFGAYIPVDERLTSAETVGQLLDVVVAQVVEHREKVAS